MFGGNMDTSTVINLLANQQPMIGESIKSIIFILLIVSIIKGFALWKAVEKNSKIWFWVLIFVNTMGILELLYLFVFSRRK
jgi:hypothetical protein